MLIKFLKKKAVEGMVKEAVKQLPELKKMAHDYLYDHVEEIFDSFWEKLNIMLNEFLEKEKELMVNLVKEWLEKGKEEK